MECPEEQEFCSTGTRGDSCTSTVSTNCGSSSENSNFRCTSLGYFPNVADCTKYFFCGLNEAGTAFEATTIECPAGNVFDPNSASFCSRQNVLLNNCRTFLCGTSTSLSYIPLTYGLNRQYYGLCVPGDDRTNPRVFVCPSNSLPNLTGLSPTCDYRCPRVGAFENTSDRTKFFDCYLDEQLRLVSVDRNCPPRAEFNTVRSQCQAIVRSLSESDDVSNE